MVSATASSATMMVMTAAVAVVTMGEQAAQERFPTTRDDDVVVADRVLQEIFTGEGRIVKLELNLGTAEVRLGEVPEDASFGDECL